MLTRKACSYDPGTRPRETPTQRIRKLEACLRSVRTSLVQLKVQNQTAIGGDIDAVINSLDLTYPEPGDGESSADDDDTKQRRLNSMMGSVGRIISHSPSQTTYYGPYSGYAFVLKTLELFRRMPDNPTLATETQSMTTTLFNAPMPEA